MNDTRLQRFCSHLDDVRSELSALEEESPPLRERQHLAAAHDAINDAIRYLNYAADRCEVCAGIGRVMRASREGNGFNWLGGTVVPCPACNRSEVG